MNKKLLSISLFFVLLNAYSVLATHIVGGELNYRWLGGNNYEISLTIYRDCQTGVPPFDNPISIGIFDNTNNLVNLNYQFTGFYPDPYYNPTPPYYSNATFNNQNYGFLIYPNDSATVPHTISSPCVIPPTGVCYRVCHYIDTIALPPIPGGYHLVYQRCCRNSSILNIVSPLNTGGTYDAWIPDVPYNFDSNPIFNSWPPTYICVNEPFVFNHSATDPEGDSLVYQLCDPLDGATFANPMPHPPFNPPYSNVIWQAPYSLGNVFGGVPLSIDPNTGILTATPNGTGQYVYAVCVLEYRNGILIGQTRRDFQVNIVVCANITVASILSPTLVCGLNMANFTNNSTGASFYYWNFGDTSTFADTSNLFQPSYQYPDTGWYVAMLVAFSSVNPLCNDTSYSNVHVSPQLVAGFNYTILPCSRTVVFNDTLSTLSGTPISWSWNFGDGNTSTNANPTHTYVANGNYNVRLIVQTNIGCIDTVLINVPVNYIPVNAAFNPTNIACTLGVNFTNTSTGATNYSWNFGDATSSTQTSPSHTYANSGNYTVTLIASNASGCADTVTQNVILAPLANAGFTFTIDTCTLTVHFTNNSTNAGSYSWNFGDASTSTSANPVHAYSTSGTYNVRLIATSLAGCTDTIIIPVSVSFILPSAAFIWNNGVCNFNVSFVNQSIGAGNYLWNFGDATTSTVQNPSHTYATPGNYVVSLIIHGIANCADTITHNIIIDPLPTAAFTQVLDTCGLSVAFNNTSVNGNSYAWNFGDAGTSTAANPSHTYGASGSYTVTLTVTDINGCTSTVSRSFTFPALPNAVFGFQQNLCSRLVTFTNSSQNATSYLWNFGDAGTSTLANPTHTYAANGNYNVMLIAISAYGCRDTLITLVPVNFIPPVAAFSYVNPLCSFVVNFTNLSTSSTSYFWNFGDSYFSNLLNPTHAYANSGTYTITLVSTNANNCSDTITQTITIAPLAQANFSVQVDTCSLTVFFTNSSSNANSYFWNFGDAATSTLQNPSHTYSAPGIYNVSLIATTPLGCSDTIVVPVPINFTLPVALFSYNIPPCSQAVSFTNQSIGGTGYTWNFGDATTSSQGSPTHIYASAGNYTVTLIVHGIATCADTITQNITVNTLPAASFNPIVDICSLTAAFANTSQNGNSYSWDFGDANTSTITNPFHSYSLPGIYVVTLVVTDINGCTDTATQTIVLPPLAVAGFTYQVDTCHLLLTLTNNSVNAVSFFWNFGDGNTSTLFNPTHVYTSSNTYNVTLVVTSASGCTDTVMIPIPVSFTPPVALFTHVTPVCSQITTFNNLSTPAINYSWDFGDFSSSAAASPVHVYPGSGNYNVVLIVATPDGCADTASNMVVIDPLPVASFTPDIDTCSLIANFINTSTNATTYLWDFGDNSGTSNANSPAHTYPGTGSYNVTLIVSDGNGCVDTLVQTVNPYVLTQAAATYTVDTCLRQVNFFNHSGFAFNYLWQFGDTGSSTNISPSYQYSNDGHYVALLITNPGTVCADTAEVIVDYSLAGIGNYWVPNAFTPNNDGKNDVWEIVGHFPCEDLTLYVFNRWGELIYQTSEWPLRWDGKYSDGKVKLEVYVYILQSEHVNEVGRVTVIR